MELNMSDLVEITQFKKPKFFPKSLAFYNDEKQYHKDSGWAFVEYHNSGVVKRRCKSINGYLKTVSGVVYQEFDSAGFVVFQITGRQVFDSRRKGNTKIGLRALMEAEAIKRYRIRNGWEPKKKRSVRPKSTNRA